MYIYPQWSYKRNFEINQLTGLLQKTDNVSDWTARCYYQNAFDFQTIDAVGFRVYHNTNSGEVTNYAVGVSNTLYTNNVLRPEHIRYGFHFHDDLIDIISNGVVVNSSVAENTVYIIEFDISTGKLNVFKDENNTFVMELNSAPLPVSDWHLFVLGHTCFNTDLDVQYDLDGIKAYKINDILYVDDAGNEFSLFTNYDSVPANTELIRVRTNYPIKESTINSDSVKLFKFIPPQEENLNDVEEVEIIAPLNWSSSNYFDIQIPSFDAGYTYQIQIGTKDSRLLRFTSIPSLETPFELKTAIFVIAGEIPEIDDETLNQYFNDIYFKLRNLDKLIDIDSIVHEIADIFDYSYKVTEYDPETNTYSKTPDEDKVNAKLSDTDKIIKFENSKIIEKLFVSEYLPEYARYMKDINDPALTVVENADTENLKEILFKNITLLNYFKGNRTQMNFLISVFSSSIGYYYVSVDPDPYYNFVYRISTSLPKKYWTDDIKDVTHPLGWNDFYVYVPRDAINWHQMKVLTEEEFESFWELNSKVDTLTYIDIADYLDGDEVIRWGNHVGNAMYDDLIEPKEFPFKETEYEVTVDYGVNSKNTDNSGLFYDLRTQFYNVNVDENVQEPQIITGEPSLFRINCSDGVTWNIDFLKNGVCSEYLWKIYRGSAELMTIKTYIPKLKFLGKFDESYRINLYLKHQNQFLMSLFNYELDNRHIKIQRDNYKNYFISSYLDKLANDIYNRYHGMLTGDSSSEKEFKHYDSNYEGELDFANINTIINTITINTTGTEHEVFFNDVSGTENLISGLFLKYKWLIRDSADTSGNILYEIETNIPNINTNGVSGNLEVLLIRDDVVYVGPNKAI